MDANGALNLARKKECVDKDGKIVACVCPNCEVIKTLAEQLDLKLKEHPVKENPNQLLIPGV